MPRAMPQRIVSALSEDVKTFIEERRLGPSIGRTHRLRLGDVTSLIVHLQNRFAVCGDVETLQASTSALRTKVHSFVALQHSLSLNDNGDNDDVAILENNNVHVTFLPQLLQHFLQMGGRHCDFSLDHLDCILRDIVPIEKTARPQRCRRARIAVPLPLEGPAAPADALALAVAPPLGQLPLAQSQVVAHDPVRLKWLEEEREKLRKSKDYYKAQYEVKKEALVEMTNAYRDLEYSVNFRNGRTVTKHGGYSLALRRAECDIGALATLKMMTHSIDGGHLSDPKTVIQYEHLAAAAKRLRSNMWRQSRDEELMEAVAQHSRDDGTGTDSVLAVEVVFFSGDATTADVLANKLYVSRTSSTVLLVADGVACVDGAGELDIDRLMQQCPTVASCCDIQVVEKGTSAETGAIWLRALESVGAPSWKGFGPRARTSYNVSNYEHDLDCYFYSCSTSD